MQSYKGMEAPKMKPQRGFTLAEMAIVVLLISIAMTMGLKMVTANLDNAAYSETKSKQERIKIALIGFLRTNKRLPCPDNKTAVAADGLEPLPAPPVCTAALADGYGIVPWQTLGIPRDTVQDGWGNYFTYRVANGTAGSKNWTSITASTPFDINELTTSTDALTIQELNAAGTALVTTTTKAVVVILSHGKNGFGAKTVKVAARIPTAGSGIGELTNATVPPGSTFVLRPITEAAAAFNGSYDDLVAYMTPQDLLQPLINEKTMKVCKSYCSSTCPGTNTCTASNVPIGNSSPTCSCTSGETLP